MRAMYRADLIRIYTTTKEMIIPTWNEAKDRAQTNYATPLDRFVADHEPLINADANQWRSDLAALISYVLAKAASDGCLLVTNDDDANQETIDFHGN